MKGLLAIFLFCAVLIVHGAEVSVTWEYPDTNGVSEFRLYQVDAVGKSILVGTAPVGQTNLTATNLVMGVWNYVLVPVDSAGFEGEPSDPVQTPLQLPGVPAARQQVSSLQLGKTWKVELSWTSRPVEEDVGGYTVWLVGTNGTNKVAETEGLGVVVLDIPAARYTFGVRAHNAWGVGPIYWLPQLKPLNVAKLHLVK